MLRDLPPRTVGFNEAATKRSRRFQTRRGSRGRVPCFNEAATKRSRRFPGLPISSATALTLQ